MPHHLVNFLTLLACTSLPGTILALESLSDAGLGEVVGQDGLSVFFQSPTISAQSTAWQDPSSSVDLRLNSLSITPLDMRIDLDAFADASGTPGLAIAASIEPFRLKSDRLGLQVNNVANSSSNTFGLLALETTNRSTFSFSNTGGLLNAASTNGRLDFDARGANWYLAQPRALTASGGNGDPTQGYNVLVFRDVNLKGNARGTFAVDPVKGFNFLGTISLPRIDSSNNGLQMDIGVKNNVNFANSRIFDFGIVNAATTEAYWRFGISGDLLSADVNMVGGGAAGIGNNIGSGIIIGSSFRFAKNTDANPFILELGEPTGSSVRFGDWVGLIDGATLSPSRARYGIGTVYVNLLPPEPSTGLGNFLTPTTSSFSNAPAFGATNVSTDINQNSAALAIRDFNLQGYARSLSFHDSVTGSQLGSPQDWSLISTFYRTNANLIAYGSGHPDANTRHGMGMDLKIETTGKDTLPGTPSTQGTHLLVADTSANTYVGFRNIDSRYSFRDAQLYAADPSFDFPAGSGLDVAGLRLSSEAMEFDIRAGFAIGDLPDGTAERRIRDDDDIFGMRWKFGGAFSFTFSPPPTGQSYIGITSTLVATNPNKNGVYIVEPVDGTRIEWTGITGTLNLVSQHVIDGNYSDASRIDILRESTASFPGPKFREMLTLATAYELAPGTGKNDVIRIGELNLYRPPATSASFTGTSGTYNEGVDWKPGLELNGSASGTGSAYTLGEMVIPGGRFYGQVDIKVK